MPARVVDWMQVAEDVLHWEAVFFKVANTKLGGFIQSDHWVVIMSPDEDMIGEIEMPKEPLKGSQAIQDHLDPTSSPIEDYVWPRDLQNLRYLQYSAGENLSYQPRVSMEFADTSYDDCRTIPVFDVDYPAPRLERRELRALDSAFVICTDDDIYGTTIRGIRPLELLSLYGFQEEERNELVTLDRDALWK